ncbi:MAG: hypothetical protein L6311_05525 [Cellulomonas sp.]|nr:hypothetical protein [Cellulomonas sp.]
MTRADELARAAADARRALRESEPELPDDAVFADLDREVRGRLRTLSKENAETVGRHLVMVGRLIDSEPETAYQHAQAAVRRAGRVDVAREAAGLAAYRTGRFAEALRELRTVRRLSGSAEHLAVLADAERGLGRPERALALAQDPDVGSLSPEAAIELAIVLSGARLDLDEPEAAVAVLESPGVRAAEGQLAVRVAQARAVALEAAGHLERAQSEVIGLSTAAQAGEDDLEIVVFDLEDQDETVDPGPVQPGPTSLAQPGTDEQEAQA